MKKNCVGCLSLILLSVLFGSCKDPASAPQTPANTITIVGPRQGLATYPYTIKAEINYKPMDVPKYVWTFSDTTITTNALRVTRAFSSMATYRYTVEAYSGAVRICEAKDSFVVKGATIELTPDSITGYPFLSYLFKVAISPDLDRQHYTLRWQFDDSIITSKRDTLSFMFRSEGEHEVKVQYLDTSGAVHATTRAGVHILANQFTVAGPQSVKVLSPAEFSVTSAAPIGGDLTYEWSFADGVQTTSTANVTHTFVAPNDQDLKVKVYRTGQLIGVTNYHLKVDPLVLTDYAHIREFRTVRVIYTGDHQYDNWSSYPCLLPGSMIKDVVGGMNWFGDSAYVAQSRDTSWNDYAHGLTTHSSSYRIGARITVYPVSNTLNVDLWESQASSAYGSETSYSDGCTLSLKGNPVPLSYLSADTALFVITGKDIGTSTSVKWGTFVKHGGTSGATNYLSTKLESTSIPPVFQVILTK